MYEVNANDNRSFRSHNASEVARVAVAWKKNGFEPKAYAIVAGDTICIREVAVSTVRQTATSLKAN